MNVKDQDILVSLEGREGVGMSFYALRMAELIDYYMGDVV